MLFHLKKRPPFFLLYLLLLSIVPMIGIGQNKALIKEGTWLGVIERTDGKEIPFSFNATLMNGRCIITFVNATETIVVEDIQKIQKDSIVITMPFFNASFELALSKPNELSGYYIKTMNGKQTKAMFTAQWNKPRFIQYQKPKFNPTGTWDVLLTNLLTNKEIISVGNFNLQEDGSVTGSFLTPTGDYRFLEGLVSGDTLHLSAFDGERAVYFKGLFINDSTIANGSLTAGFGLNFSWHAKSNPKAVLPDEYAYSKMKPGNTKLDFSYKDTEGKVVSINDEKYKNKVVIVQLFGSWCPNCMDETRFMTQFYQKNKARGIEVIALAYENYEDPKEANTALKKYKKQFGINYPILNTGVGPSDPLKAEKSLPQLDKIAGYPSTIFIDKKGEVRKIHTGFSGPGTGAFYITHIHSFNKLVDALVAEK